MSVNDDEVFDPAEEECPGPADLESALFTETLNNVITQPPLVIETSTTLAEIISRMREEARGCALVTESGQLVGIFTERDVLMRVAGRPIDFERAMVREYMTRHTYWDHKISGFGLRLSQGG